MKGGGDIEFLYGYNVLVTKEHMQIFKIIAILLLGFWLNLKFTLKYITVGGEGWVLERKFTVFIQISICQSTSLQLATSSNS